MYKFTLCFIIQGTQILMLNRNKNPWMGCWNGVGGKLEQGETPLECITREIEEETPIKAKDLEIISKGLVTWNQAEMQSEGGLYLFVAYHKGSLEDNHFPIKTREGLLDLKEIDWITNHTNLGVSHNIKYFLPNALNSNDQFEYRCTFAGDTLVKVETILLDHTNLGQK